MFLYVDAHFSYNVDECFLLYISHFSECNMQMILSDCYCSQDTRGRNWTNIQSFQKVPFFQCIPYIRVHQTRRSGRLLCLVSMKSPISVKKRSFSRPVSLFKSVFFSPIIIIFLQYSHERSSHVPEM